MNATAYVHRDIISSAGVKAPVGILNTHSCIPEDLIAFSKNCDKSDKTPKEIAIINTVKNSCATHLKKMENGLGIYSPEYLLK